MNGKLHRLNGPAIEFDLGDGQNIHMWYQNGRLHRTDGPAIMWGSGDEEWWMEGLRHRCNGPAIHYQNKFDKWYQKGQLHRLDGPAIIYADGKKEWWTEDNLHRNNGPAVEYVNGRKEWWVHGKIDFIKSYSHLQTTVKSSINMCSICYDKDNTNNKWMILNCSHEFHCNCLLPWLIMRDNCPLCRQHQ